MTRTYQAPSAGTVTNPPPARRLPPVRAPSTGGPVRPCPAAVGSPSAPRPAPVRPPSDRRKSIARRWGAG
ncbi:hypothetical protein GCM10010519_57230 [Streptomyces lactacystinicus]